MNVIIFGASGMDEQAYRRVTHDLTLAAGETLARLNPEMTFCYVSGMGTDSSEQGRPMWARVKGKTDNDLLRLPFKAVMFRPAFIQPKRGVRSKTAWYQAMYTVMGPLYPVWKTLFPGFVTTTEKVGRAMIRVALAGAPQAILENREIDELGA